MRKTLALTALALTLLILSPAVQAQTIVENFSARLVVNAEMPGATLADGTIRFGGSVQVVELSFTRGSVPYDGKWIEFAGHEAEFMGSTYGGFGDFAPAPALQLKEAAAATCIECVDEPTLEGVSTASGSVEGSINFATNDITKGSRFSSTSLDVGPVGVVMNNNSTVETWSSTAVPELNGAAVTCAADEVLVSVDAASGVAELTLAGNVVATGSTTGGPCCIKPKDPTLPAEEVNAAGVGLGLLLAGLGGQGLLLARRRRRRS
jgi:hypothetical protein